MTQIKNKTDKLDARNLARLQRTQLQARTSLVTTAKAQAARVRGLLRAHGVKVGPISAGQFVSHVTKLVANQVPALTATLAPLLHIYTHAQKAAKAVAQQVTHPSR